MEKSIGKNKFLMIKFQHVHRELNEGVDKLSKKAPSLQEGLLVHTETLERRTSQKEVHGLF